MANISCSGGFIPSVVNTALDARTVIENIEEMANISYPFVGMVVYVKNENKLYLVTSLKAKNVMGISTPDSQVDGYESLAIEFATTDEVNAMMEELGLN